MLRPWPAEDGALVRIRLVGGRIDRAGLAALGAVADSYGDGDLHLTKRTNLQLRALPAGDRLPAEVETAIRATGLLPSPAHDLVRNVMVSPLSGIDGGRADLVPVAASLDRLLCADDRLPDLPGRFLFVLDDGRGDVVGRPVDLGLVAVSAEQVQLRAGRDGWGQVVGLAEAPAALLRLAHAFLDVRGEGPAAAWHVDELARPLVTGERDPRTRVHDVPTPYGAGPGYEHRPVADGVLTATARAALLAEDWADPLVVTPWHGLVLRPA